MICSACQAENKDGAKFCKVCGTALIQGCPSCGAPYEAGQRFCDECGAALSVAAPEPVTAPEPAVVAEVAPELRLVSVLFVDLVGFTALSEAREAEDVRDLLGRYFDSARTIVDRYGGVVEKFIGDAVMAVWGAPVAREDDAERAVRAALEIVDAVSVFGEELGASGLRARAGVTTGQVAALENPGEGLVVGDRVNTASRVQSSAEPGTVLVDEVTRHVTSAAIAYEDAGERTVKGKAEPLRLWCAVRVVAGVGGREREQEFEAPFVGREGDLRLLKELLHGAVERRAARLVAVSGAAGVGKTRLRREFFKYIDGLADTFLWHSGRCLSYGEGVAYWALAEMVRQRLGIAEDAPARDAASKLEAGLDRWIPDAADREFLSPRLGALIGVAEPGLGREELFAGWRLFFERLAEHQPVILVFEDLQWADAGLLDFIEHMLEWSAASPVFTLTLSRPELAPRPDGWPAGRRGAMFLALEPLDDGAMGELLDGLVAGLPKQAADRIVAQAEGVPLYAIETIRALADRGVVAEHDGHLELVGELGELDVPASLGSLLAARLDALGRDERALVKAMSVFGGAFPRSSAVALSEIPEEQLDALLDALVRKQVLMIRADPLSPDRGQYAFAQGMLRTVAYEMLSRGERKLRHRAAAEHLRHAFPNDGEDVAEVIASHYLDAYRAAMEDPDADELRALSLDALKRAAQRAATVGAPEVAERSYRTAADLTTDVVAHAELTQAAGEMAFHAGRLHASLELLEAAADALTAAGHDREAARITRSISRSLVRLGRNEEAAERLVAALDTLGPEKLDPEVGALNGALGHALAFAGRYEAAAPAIEASLVIAQALELPQLLCNALIDKAVIYLQTSRVEEARGLLETAAEVAEREDLPDELNRAHGNSANLRLQWDVAGVSELLESSMAIAQRRGDRYMIAHNAGNRMQVHLLAGRWDEIERIAAEVLDDEDRPATQTPHYPLAVLAALRGDTARARQSLARLAAWKETEDPEFRAIHGAGVVVVLLAEGRAEEALEHGEAMLDEAIGKLSVANESVRYAWPDTLEAALELGRVDRARRLVARLADEPKGHVPPFLRYQLARGRALTNAAAGDQETVEADLMAAIDGFRALGYPYWLARAELDLAAWLQSQGRDGESAPLMADAVERLEMLGAAPALARARALQASLADALTG
jgi:class 3 adenylate cyclase/tetratricopeptide (TPR) repeat protein